VAARAPAAPPGCRQHMCSQCTHSPAPCASQTCCCISAATLLLLLVLYVTPASLSPNPSPSSCCPAAVGDACDPPPICAPCSPPLTLAEAVLEAAGQVLHVPHAPRARGLTADGLLTPLDCGGVTGNTHTGRQQQQQQEEQHRHTRTCQKCNWGWVLTSKCRYASPPPLSPGVGAAAGPAANLGLPQLVGAMPLSAVTRGGYTSCLGEVCSPT
jgi:hypothetical protein